jgi:protein involved in polysaccharide export with SLBB domain
MRFGLILLVALGSCLPVAGTAMAQPPRDAAGDSVAMDWSRVPEYRLVPGDLLNLNFGPDRVESWRDVVREALVRPDGRITVFPVGDVIAAGKTPVELERDLVQLLGREILEPRVVVEVAKLAANQVHVLGSVQRPGSFEAGAFVTVLQAVAMAGGFTDDAARNGVLVFHRNGANTVHVRRIELDRAIKSASLAADAPLSRFDIVYVPRSTIGNISTFVRQFFGSAQTALSATLIGWELFESDRSVVVAR